MKLFQVNTFGCMTHGDTKANVLQQQETEQRTASQGAGEDRSVCTGTAVVLRLIRCFTHLLSYPMHHDCPMQPCFHTLTIRVKACTHGCLWATSVTSLSLHTLGLT